MRKGEVYGARAWCILVCGLLATRSPLASAARGAYGFGYISEYTTNIERVSEVGPTQPTDEWINTLVAGASYTENTADFAANVVGQVELRDYAKNSFSEDIFGTLAASALWTLSPQRFTWTLENAFRMVTLDPTVASTPRNVAGANAFETGPDAYFRLGPRNTFSLGARYGNVYVGDTELDDNRYSGVARWLWQLSSRTVWSLNAEHINVDYKNDELNESFRRNDLYLRLQIRQARSEFILDGGRSRIDRETELDGSLARLELRRQLTSESTFGLSAASGYQDAGAELLDILTGPTEPAGVIAPLMGTDVITDDIYYRRQADVYYERVGTRLAGTLRLITRELDFETLPEDRNETGGSLELQYRYSATLGATLFGEHLNVEYLQVNPRREDRDSHYGLRLAYLVARNLSLGLEGRRIERASTSEASEFVDKRVLLTLLYSTAPLYSPLSRR